MEHVIKELKEIGASRSILAAIDTYDMAHIVRMAAEALHHFSYPCILTLGVEKNKRESAEHRIIGNECYRAGMDEEAIKYYNKALALAPKHSDELMLAYGNRSAVFLRIGYITACIQDINICLSMRCSEDLSEKLKKRLRVAGSLPCKKQPFPNEHFAKSFLRLNSKRNADVPCASDDVTFEDGTKRVLASRDIKPGTVVAIEEAFATCARDRSLSCYNCYKVELSLHPCHNCVEALFCSEHCRTQCLKEYHNIDCHIADKILTGMTPANKLMTISAIKLSLKLGWDEFIAASEDVGASRMNTATISQTFNREYPLSILSYNDDKLFLEGRMFNGSIICAKILKDLGSIPNYFPQNAKKRKLVEDAMARVMLSLYTTFTNMVPILSPATHFVKRSCISRAQSTVVGWFSMSSKLKHSCEPNLLLVGLNNSVALLSGRTIREGEELTISYIDHFYEMNVDQNAYGVPARSVKLFVVTQMLCSCRVCKGSWDCKSAVNVTMTNKQAKLYKEMESSPASLSYVRLREVCDALDAFPNNSTQHRAAYTHLGQILCAVQCIFTGNICINSM